MGERSDTLDITQEVFISALNGLQAYDAKKASFRTWLFRIGTYKVIDSWRKQKMVWFELEEETLGYANDLDTTIYQRELLNEINQYVANFRPEIQEIFRLRVYGNCSFPEIASALYQKEEKIKAQYYRLITKIRKKFSYNV